MTEFCPKHLRETHSWSTIYATANQLAVAFKQVFRFRYAHE